MSDLVENGNAMP